MKKIILGLFITGTLLTGAPIEPDNLGNYIGKVVNLENNEHHAAQYWDNLALVVVDQTKQVKVVRVRKLEFSEQAYRELENATDNRDRWYLYETNEAYVIRSYKEVPKR